MGINLYNHNQIAYDKVIEQFKSTNKTCIIHPTGTGKSFVSLQFLFDNKDKKCLFMCPTYTIKEQLIRHINNEGLSLDDFPNLEICLYASAKNIKDNKYDCIVFDEFHRIGAEEWGKNIKKLIDNNPESKILGLSATPIRYLDDNRDMSEEIFNKNIASEITLEEALLKKILPIPLYIGAIYSFDDEINQIQKQIDSLNDRIEAKKYQKQLNLAKNMLQNSEGLDQIFINNINNKNGKYLVFCKDYKHMKLMKSKSLDWFKNVNTNIEINEVYSKINKKINDTVINCFENNKNNSLKLLFSIDMLNEGLHVNDVDGIIMFRPTESPILYFQQLGRALSVNHEQPLIFDVVNNFSLLESIYNIKNKMQELINKIITDRNNNIEHADYPSNKELLLILNKFKIIEDKIDLVNLLKFIKKETANTWDKRCELATAFYKKYGHLIVPNNFKTNNGVDYDENGFNLSAWIQNNRQNYKNGKLNEEQIIKLNNIGMLWNIFDIWLKKYELATTFYKKYGNLDIPSGFKTKNGTDYDENGLDLYNWILRQKDLFINEKLSKKQIRLLNKIGMNFDKYTPEKRWFENYHILENYYSHYKTIKIKRGFKTKNGIDYDEYGLDLNNWVYKQKSAYINNKLNENQIKLLINIGINLEKFDKMKLWLEHYSLAKIYFEHNGNLNIKQRFRTSNGYEFDPKGFYLGGWLDKQKNAFKNGELTKKQIKLLKKIGMNFNIKDVNQIWLEKYKIAKEFYEKFGHLNIPTRYITEDGIALGSWLKYQKQAYRGVARAKISDEQIRLLEEIGIDWFTIDSDLKLQSEIIDGNNYLQKKIEILSRFKSVLSEYPSDTFPTNKELNKTFIYKLDRK